MYVCSCTVAVAKFVLLYKKEMGLRRKKITLECLKKRIKGGGGNRGGVAKKNIHVGLRNLIQGINIITLHYLDRKEEEEPKREPL